MSVPRLARNPAFWAWLPVVVLPPVLVLDAALSERRPGDDAAQRAGDRRGVRAAA